MVLGEKHGTNYLPYTKKNAMLDEYSTVSVVVIDTVVNALLYILSGLFIIKGEFTIGGAFAFITY